MAFGGPRSSCVRPGAHSARRLRSLAFLGSSSAYYHELERKCEPYYLVWQKCDDFRLLVLAPSYFLREAGKIPFR